MIQPTATQLKVACDAARQAIKDYSAFDSAMVPDSALETVVSKALVAALNIAPKGK